MADQPSSSNNAAGNRRRSAFGWRFSTLSIGTLPGYSVTDDLTEGDQADVGEPPNFEASAPSSSAGRPAEGGLHSPPASASLSSAGPYSPALPQVGKRYSYINPLYSTVLNTASRTPIIPQLEGAAARPRGFDFEYSYPNRPNKPWATLQLFTRDAILGDPNASHSQPKTPRIWSSEPLAGVIQLDIDNPLSIQQISLQIKGKITTSSLDEGSYTFINHQYLVWSKSMGDPRESPAVESSVSKGKFDGKFHGQYNIPFSFAFPAYVDLLNKAAVRQEGPILSPNPLSEEPSEDPPPPFTPSPVSPTPDKGKKKRVSWNMFSSKSSSKDSSAENEQPKRRRSALSSDMISGSTSPSRQSTADAGDNETALLWACPMPQSFVDKGLIVTLIYELTVVFTHGRFRPDSRIKTQIYYLPSVEPLPISVQRQQAYEAGALLPGPKSDPTGWFALSQVAVQGFYSDASSSRRVEVDCTLYLAQPLAYTRGTVIPCYMSLHCFDAQALQSLSNPKALNVRLIRQFRHFTPHGGDRTTALEEQFARGYFGAGSAVPVAPIVLPTGAAGATGMGGELKTVVHEITHAVWWTPSKEVYQDPTSRWVEGEIHLEPSLQPSCVCPIFSVEYIVEMYHPRSAHFEPDIHPSLAAKARAGHAPAVAAQSVEITTLYRLEEPVPTTFSEPPKSKLRVISAEPVIEHFQE